jgi:GNAT superfamily N-acetyltransferase
MPLRSLQRLRLQSHTLHSLAEWTYRLLDQVLHYRSDVLLMKKITTLEDHAGWEIVEHTTYDESLWRLYHEFGRPHTPMQLYRQMTQRFSRGLRLFSLAQQGQTLATTWISPGRERFFHEYGYCFHLPADGLWLIDIYVAPAARGQRLFSTFLDVLLARHFPGARIFWSDVAVKDAASLAAHRHYGFQPVGVIQGLRLSGLLLMRTMQLEHAPLVCGFRPERRLLFTGPTYWAFCNPHQV